MHAKYINISDAQDILFKKKATLFHKEKTVHASKRYIIYIKPDMDQIPSMKMKET